MHYLSRNTLTTKLVLLTSVLVTLIILTTGFIFSATYNFLLENEARNFLVKEGEEVVADQIILESGVLKYRVSGSGEDLANRLRGYNLSAIIYDTNLTRLGSYGIYKNLTESGQLGNLVPENYLHQIITGRQSAFSSFRLPTGITYDTYTTVVLASGQPVGLVQFAKESDYKSRALILNLTVLALLLPLVILASWFAYRFLIRKSLTPLNELILHLQKVKPEDSLQKISLSSHPTDEITQLVDSFNRLLDRVGESISKQKDFIAHASHELRTPLTSAITSLDLAIHYRGKDKSIQHINAVKQDLLNMSTILDSLLLLSRLENTNSTPQPKQLIEVRSFITEILKTNSEDIKKAGLNVNLDCPSDIRIEFPKNYFKILISNLISNAIKFSFLNGEVNIKVKPLPAGTSIQISNTGSTISPDDKKHIFDRFYRSSSTSGISGSGLGLALVKQICEACHVDLTVDSSAHITTFTLTFN